MSGIRSRDRGLRRGWPLALTAIALTPVLGLFTTRRIFFVRDLSLFFWSRHLWLRHTIAGGAWPLWDPYAASGLDAAADALNQVWMPITLAIRLLPSDVISFNLWVALPLPLAMLGTYVFLQRRHGPSAAALGACVFTLSGAMVSTLNAPNLSWSMACLPWLAWAADRVLTRPGFRGAALLGLVCGLQALSGEPVTLAASVLLVIACVIADDRAAGAEGKTRRRALAWVVTGLFLGAALSAVQMIPTMLAGIAAHRATWSETPDFWSLHPLGLLETVVPHLFGNYYDAFLADMPWMTRLNSGREPFFYSVYIGPLVMLLVAAALAARPRRSAVWAVLAAVFALAAMGGYTPFYPLARRIFPPLTFFRFPVKYIALSFFAAGVLSASAWDLIERADLDAHRRISRVAVIAGVAAAALGAALVAAVAWPTVALRTARGLAVGIGITDAEAAAAYLVRVGTPLAARSAGLLLAGAGLLAVAAGDGRRRRAAAWLLFAAVVGDLAITNGSLNPTTDVTKMNPPAWYVALSSAQRLYIGGRLRGFMDPNDPDGSKKWEIPAEPTAVEGRQELNARLPMEPSGWRVREALTYDLPVLLPAEYTSAVTRFRHATAAERAAFLRRAAVRWCVLPEDAAPAAAVVTDVPGWYMTVRDCDPAASRAFIAHRVDTVSEPAAALDALFDPRLADTTVRVAEAPPPAGRSGAAGSDAVAIEEDGANTVVLNATLVSDGVVVLRDSFSPWWRATVDGEPAMVMRANGLFRAVHVRAGRHVIRFDYRPRPLAIGLIVTGMTALLLLTAVFARPARRQGPNEDLSRRRGAAAKAEGFTLVELMVVIAIIGILLGLAFARYQGMQARANDASAYSSLRAIVTAERTFAMTCGNQKFAITFPALGEPAPTTGQAFLSPDLTSAEVIAHSGYVFQMAAKALDDAPRACNGAPVGAGFAVTADPVTPGRSGTRYFGTNGDGVIFEDPAQSFAGNMPESGPPGHGTEVRQHP